LGEAAELLLGEDHLVADGDLEDAARALDQLRLDAEALADVGRQTGGARVVVSGDAVLDPYVRHVSTSGGDYRPGRLGRGC
jgi:hypothetical protein